MKALSLLQPWASLVVMGAKQFETRSWRTHYRGWLWIHASLGKPDKTFQWLAATPPQPGNINFWNQFVPDLLSLPYGAIIGSVELVNCISTSQMHGKISEQENMFGDYGHGRFAWELRNPFMLKTPFLCKGALSIWDTPPAFPGWLIKNEPGDYVCR